MPRFYFAFRPGRPPTFEATYPREVWEDPTVWRRIGSMRSLARRHVRPTSRSAFRDQPGRRHARSLGRRRGRPGRAEHAGWLRDEGGPCPGVQEPDAVYAVLRPELWSRRIRNPAWAVLRRHGIIAQGRRHREWLDALGRQVGGARHFPHRPGPAAAPRGSAPTIEAYVSERPGRQDALMDHLRDACRAMGIALPRNTRGEDDFLVDLLDSPWLPVEAPGLGAIQLIAAGEPATACLSDGVTEADVNDLGDQSRHYEPLPRHIVREALRQRFGRERSALRRHHGPGGRRGASPVAAAAPRPVASPPNGE